MDQSFTHYLQQVKQRVQLLNAAASRIGVRTQLPDTDPAWMEYSAAQQALQELVMNGQSNNGTFYAVKNCIADFEYEKQPDGQDQLPARITGFSIRGWVQYTTTAEFVYSSSSSSSSVSSGGG